MKYRIITATLLLVSTLSWQSSSAHIVVFDPGITASETPSCSIWNDTPEHFIIHVCFTAVFVNICFDLDCDLHWADILQPGLGQLLGHEGCKIKGVVSGGQNGDVTFEGDGEDMIGAIERAQGLPPGGLNFIDILQSPTFPGPDGNDYRVIVNRYQVVQDANGRYLPLKVEQVK